MGKHMGNRRRNAGGILAPCSCGTLTKWETCNKCFKFVAKTTRELLEWGLCPGPRGS